MTRSTLVLHVSTGTPFYSRVYNGFTLKIWVFILFLFFSNLWCIHCRTCWNTRQRTIQTSPSCRTLCGYLRIFSPPSMRRLTLAGPLSPRPKERCALIPKKLFFTTSRECHVSFQFAQARQLVKDGFLVEVSESSRKLRHVFLFTDLLLCAKMKKTSVGWASFYVFFPTVYVMYCTILYMYVLRHMMTDLLIYLFFPPSLCLPAVVTSNMNASGTSLWQIWLSKPWTSLTLAIVSKSSLSMRLKRWR